KCEEQIQSMPIYVLFRSILESSSPATDDLIELLRDESANKEEEFMSRLQRQLEQFNARTRSLRDALPDLFSMLQDDSDSSNSLKRGSSAFVDDALVNLSE